MSETTVERPYPTFKSLPIEVKVYIGLLQAIFIPVLVFVLLKDPFKGINWLDFIVFTALSIILVAKSVKVSDSAAILSIDSIIYFSAILLFKPEQAFIIIVFSQLAGDIVAKSRNWAIFINYPEATFGFYLAALVFNKLKSTLPYFKNLIVNLPAIITAIVVVLVSNYLLHLTIYLRLYRDMRFKDAIKEIGSSLVVYDLGQFPISIAIAIAYHYQRFSLILFILPVLLFYIVANYQSRVYLKEQEAVEERKRIEQDAHDRVYNKLGALAKKAELAANSNEATGEAKKTLDLLQKDLRVAVKDLQNIVSAKDKIVAEGFGFLMAELRDICTNFKNRSSIDLDFDFQAAAVSKISPKDSWHIQCILDECFNNVIKHSQATQVKAFIRQDNGHVVLRVEDNGIGIKTNPNGSGKGLSGMQERARKMNATVSFAPNNGKGTAVELRLSFEV